MSGTIKIVNGEITSITNDGGKLIEPTNDSKGTVAELLTDGITLKAVDLKICY